MQKRILLPLAGLVAGLLLFANAEAQMMQGQQSEQGMKCPMMGQGMQGGMMSGQGMMGQSIHSGPDFFLGQASQLQLTDDQVQKLREQKFAFEKAEAQRQADLRVAQLDLQQLQSANNVDVKKTETQIRAIHNKTADLAVAAFAAQQQAKSVLTDEQKAKVATLASSMCQQMKDGSAMMQGGMMHQGGMMRQQNQQEDSSSAHAQHHPKN